MAHSGKMRRRLKKLASISRGQRVPETLLGPPKPFPFLQLPAELRNRIYTLALYQSAHRDARCGHWHSTTHRVEPAEKGNIVILDDDDWFQQTSVKHQILAPSLLQINQQVRAESAALHYGMNRFTVVILHGSLDELDRWLQVICGHSKLLQTLVLRFEGFLSPMDPVDWLMNKAGYLSPLCVVKAAGSKHMVDQFHKSLAWVDSLTTVGLACRLFRRRGKT